MNKYLIKQKLEKMKGNQTFDSEYVDLLLSSYLKNEDGETIAKKIITQIDKKYVKNQTA